MSEIQRGREAEAVLSNAIYKEAYAQIEQNLVNKLAQQATAPKEAKRLRYLLIALRMVHRYLDQVMKTGVMAEMQEKKPTISERWQRFVA